MAPWPLAVASESNECSPFSIAQEPVCGELLHTCADATALRNHQKRTLQALLRQALMMCTRVAVVNCLLPLQSRCRVNRRNLR